MLQSIRSWSDSIIFKLLFGLLIISFCGWGVYDVLLRATPDISVASVGDRKIGPEQLSRAVQRRIEQMRQVFGGSFDLQQAKQLGIVDQELDGLINAALIDLEVQRLKLALGDQAVLGEIMETPAFKDSAGKFDPQIYRQLLARNGYTEAQYEAGLRGELVRGELTEAVVSGASAPNPLVDVLYRNQAEKRVAETVFLPFALVTDIGQPSESDLQKFHDEHADLFRAPELRSFTIALATIDELAKTIQISDSDLKTEYEQRRDELAIPERRHLEQAIAPDQATADLLENALKGGKTFAAATAEVKLGPPRDLGTIAKKDLDPAVADAVFALPQDGATAPIKTPFGFNILHVTAIEPGRAQTLDEVKDALRLDMQRNEASDVLDRLSKRVQDALAGGASLETMAGNLGLKIVKVANSDKSGHTAGGGTAEIPAPAKEFLDTAFTTSEGETSPVEDTSDGAVYVLRVDKITPSSVQPLADVHDRVLAAWQQEQRIERVGKETKEIADAVNAGTPLKDVAGKRALKTTTTPPIEREGETGGLPDTMVGPLFQLKLHQATTGQSTDGSYVAELLEIIPADPSADKSKVDQLSQQLRSAMQQDLVSEYENALRSRFKVEIDRDRVNHAL